MPSQRRYSSNDGCCICGTNTSIEPFASVDKISPNKKSVTKVFWNCFQLEKERSGDICVSCLAIAKKWLRTSKSKRNSVNFKKVVDSKRRFRQRTTRQSSQSTELSPNATSENAKEDSPAKTATAEEVVTRTEDKKEITQSVIEDGLSEDENEEEIEDENEISDLPEDLPLGFDPPCFSPDVPYDVNNDVDNDGNNDVGEKKTVTTGTQTAFLFPALTSPQANANKLPFIDLSKWRQEEICCGTIFRGPNGEVLVDPKWLRPSCEMCNRSSQPPTPVEKNRSEEISVFDNKLASLCS